MANLTLCSSHDKCTLKYKCKRFLDDDKHRFNIYSTFSFWNGECNAFFADQTVEERLDEENTMRIEARKERF